jgi:hypothetical protein
MHPCNPIIYLFFKSQLLARRRYLLTKRENHRTENQKERAKILFKIYPDLKFAYQVSSE